MLHFQIRYIAHLVVNLADYLSIFDRLLLSKQLRFSDGDIELLGNRMVLTNAHFLADYILQINDSPDSVAKLYEAAKLSFMEHTAKKIGLEYAFTFNDYFKWLTNIAMMSGWGNFKWHSLDEEKKEGVILVNSSPIADKLRGKTEKPVDHIIRGFVAGGASAALGIDIDVSEPECEANGHKECRFILKPSGKPSP